MIKKIFLAVLMIVCFTQTILLCADDSVDVLVQKGDEFHNKWKHQESLDVYQQAARKDSNNYQVLWRTARAYTKIAQNAPDDAKEKFYQLAMDTGKKAVALNPNDAQGHLWLAIAEGRLALFKGGKEKVSLSKEVKSETEMVLKLDPRNDIAYHILGCWHREVATLNPVLKVFAKIIYGGLPAADIQEAVTYLQKSVALRPDGIEHRLELGKTYSVLKNYDLARAEFNKCLSLTPVEERDAHYQREASAFLDKMKNK